MSSKVEEEKKDRHSNDPKSSVKAPPKKDGAGGKYTMGKAEDQDGPAVLDKGDPNYDSEGEEAEQEKKEKKAEERAAQFDKKRKSMEEQKEQFEKDLAAIEEEKRKAGLKFMKLVQKKRAKEEL
mmetsp:Transcript_36577/g.87575  ORF Transcript_36577/g.87575 Transcript_36577/m.87575 type:complete len:124 (+) Transcript_36577:56-427(+)